MTTLLEAGRAARALIQFLLMMGVQVTTLLTMNEMRMAAEYGQEDELEELYLNVATVIQEERLRGTRSRQRQPRPNQVPLPPQVVQGPMMFQPPPTPPTPPRRTSSAAGSSSNPGMYPAAALPEPVQPMILCDCGLRAVKFLCRQGEPANVGKSFWRCPHPPGSQCRYFQWCGQTTTGCTHQRVNRVGSNAHVILLTCTDCKTVLERRRREHQGGGTPMGVPQV
jgi:hypothetical protein